MKQTHGRTDARTGLARALLLLCICASVPSGPAVLRAQQGVRQAPRSCQIHVDSANGSTQFVKMPDSSQNVFSGGGVWARCVNDPTRIYSDSLTYVQASGILEFIGRVKFRDSTAVLDADKVTYWVRQERLYAEGHVYTRNVANGSEMRGPNLNYLRAVPPVRDTLELYMIGRPTIRFQPGATDSVKADTTDPFVIVADRVRMRHTDRMWGSGHVTIDRSDLNARSDSAQLDLADSVGLLIGAAVVVGRDSARGRSDTTASYRLVGQRIRFNLDDRQQIRHVLSSGDADARGPDWHLVSDTLDMALDSGHIQRAQAWGRESRPVAVSNLSHITADSLDIQMPAQIMRLVWAYGRARATSKPDSTMVEDDWLSGDTLRANFAAVDSAGRQRSEIERVTAFGTARAYYHTDNEHDPHGERGINYSRGNRIQIAMREGKVRVVDIVGSVDGIYLEPRAPGWDTIPADSNGVRTSAPGSERPNGSTPPAPRPAPGAGTRSDASPGRRE
jgi:lipopolysaccharide export system protein LptA